MKAIYLLITLSISTSSIGLCQKINAVELCNGTKSLYYFGTATSSIKYFLFSGDISTLDEVRFSNREKLSNEYFLSLSERFDSVFKKFGLTELPSSSNVEVKIGKGLWHEINYYYFGKKSDKQIPVMQLLVLFKGDNAEAEKNAPEVEDVNLRLGKALVGRKAYLKSYKSVQAPPKL